MTTAAREVLDRGRLAELITGAYPTTRLKRAAELTHTSRRGRVARLLERDESLPARQVTALATSELLYDGARLLGHVPAADGASQRLCGETLRLYGARAARRLSSLRQAAAIYHLRAGFGQRSIGRAHERGMHVLCDHAIVHPFTLGGLIASRGTSYFDPPGAGPGSRESLTALDQAILDDINRSDSVLVNSEFVRQTFLACGWRPDRVHVAYLGVDENFLAGVGESPRTASSGPLHLLFAGRFERRKGADVLVEALKNRTTVPWRLTIAGPVTRELSLEHATFLADPRVTVLGTISRRDLAREMQDAPIFVFPSYAEGSARAVFEALSCRCYVITTPNSGTIVEDGVHGALIPPGDADALAAALADAAANPEGTAATGNHNAVVIHDHYRQAHYGDALIHLYDRLEHDAQ